MTLLSDDSDDSSDSAHCPTSETETTSTARDNEGIVATLPFAAPPSTLPIVATLPLLLKNICSKRWSHCPETIVSKGTGTLSVAVGEA